MVLYILLSILLMFNQIYAFEEFSALLLFVRILYHNLALPLYKNQS